MARSTRRFGATPWAAVVLWLGVVSTAAVWGQTPPQPESEQLLPPEQMIEEALKKIDAGDLQQADTLLRRARVLKPTMDKIKLVEGLLALGVKNRIAALSRLEAYNKTEEGRNDYRGFLAVGRVYKDSNMFRLAVLPLETAKAIAPLEENGRRVRAETAVELADAYFSLPRKDKALEAAKEAQKLAPDDAKVQLRLGQIAFRSEDYETAAKGADRAIELLVAAMRLDPLKRDTYGQFNSCYLLKRDLERKLNPNSAASYYRLAIVARNAAEISRLVILLDARDNANQALTKEPDNLEYLLFAARLEADLGAVDEAREKVGRILKSNPEHREAIELQERLKLGTGGFTGK